MAGGAPALQLGRRLRGFAAAKKQVVEGEEENVERPTSNAQYRSQKSAITGIAWQLVGCLMGWRTMANKFIVAVAAITLSGIGALVAQEKPAEANLVIDKKTYQLTQAVAFETTIDNEEAIAVVLSRQPVRGEKIKEARENDKQGGDTDFGRPFLKLVFKKTGELKHWSAAAGGTTLGRHSDKAMGEIHVENGRATGKASQPLEKESMFPSSFEVRFDVALLKAGDSPPPTVIKKPGPAANIPPSVTGIFKGNGKDAKLAFVSARWGEPFDGKPGIVVVFTEKDHSKAKKPDFDAAFGKFGSALVISLHDDGRIYGCQVVHSAHKKQGFSSVGSTEMNPITYDEVKVAGEITTNGQVDTFGETWEVKLKFVAPLGEIPKEFQVAPEPEKKKEKATSDSDKD